MSIEKMVIFCKSYSKDLYRAKRMAESVHRFNRDGISLFLSVPSSEIPLFKNALKEIPCFFLTDEDVLSKCYEVYGNPPNLFPKHLLQQLIKMEFWRMGLCKYYLWIDSDSYFLNPFYLNDFFSEDKNPLLVMHKAQELKRFARIYNKQIIKDLDTMVKNIQDLFGRKGEPFYFGDPPLLWSCSMLESMYHDFLKTKNMSIFELLYKYPCEMQLYGEYCLASNEQQIIPTEPFFKVFHYLEQFCEAQRNGESEYSISKEFLGIVMQSNWSNEKEIKKNNLARFRKFIRNQQRKFGFIRW